MSAPDPEGMSLLAKVIAAGTAVAAPIGWLWAKLDKKADKEMVKEEIAEVKAETSRHRDHIARLFEKMEEHSRRDEEAHRTVLEKMSENHAEILRALSTKADRR